MSDRSIVVIKNGIFQKLPSGDSGTISQLAVTNQGEVRFRELSANGTNYIGLKAPATLTGDTTFTLPSADGSSGQVLQTNGSAVLSFITSSTSATYYQETPSGTVNSSNVTFTVANAPATGKSYYQETPSGTVNSSNVTFTLANTPSSTSVVGLFVNGLKKRLTTDYSISGSTITFVTAPGSGSTLWAAYTSGDQFSIRVFKNGILVIQGSGANNYTFSGTTITFGTAPTTGTDLYCEYSTDQRERQELPTGTVNSSNVTFTISQKPITNTALRVYLDGLYQTQGAGLDYTISSQTITFTTAPGTGQLVYCSYPV